MILQYAVLWLLPTSVSSVISRSGQELWGTFSYVSPPGPPEDAVGDLASLTCAHQCLEKGLECGSYGVLPDGGCRTWPACPPPPATPAIAATRAARMVADVGSCEGRTGVVNMDLGDPCPAPVLCKDGWLVFQHREDGCLMFENRTWAEYRDGFGHPAGDNQSCYEFWLGNSRLAALTATDRWRLRIELTDWESATAWAEYTLFSVAKETLNFRLNVGGYHGTLGGDSLGSLSNNGNFSTIDRDNDSSKKYHCSEVYAGGFWYNSCSAAKLNSHYYEGGNYTSSSGWANGVVWAAWRGRQYSLKTTYMMLRRFQ